MSVRKNTHTKKKDVAYALPRVTLGKVRSNWRSRLLRTSMPRGSYLPWAALGVCNFAVRFLFAVRQWRQRCQFAVTVGLPSVTLGKPCFAECPCFSTRWRALHPAYMKIPVVREVNSVIPMRNMYPWQKLLTSKKLHLNSESIIYLYVISVISRYLSRCEARDLNT